MNNERLFICIYPGGIVYADRTVEEAGDYKRLAFLPYSSLELEIKADCPTELAEQIRTDAADIQARRGQQFQVSACNQTVMLGGGK